MTLVLVGKQRGTLISGSTYSIPAPPSSPGSSLPPLSVLGWLPLRRRQKPGALTGARLWVLSSPPGVSWQRSRRPLCALFCLLRPGALLQPQGCVAERSFLLPPGDSLLCPFLHIPALTCGRRLLLLFSLRATPQCAGCFQI